MLHERRGRGQLGKRCRGRFSLYQKGLPVGELESCSSYMFAFSWLDTGKLKQLISSG